MLSLSQMNLKYTDIIQVQWANNYLLGINSISYGNGLVTLLSVYSSCNTANGVNHGLEYRVFPKADTTIDSIIKYNDDPWTEIQVYSSPVTDGKLTYICGEGSMGNEGFVAAINNDGLVWSLFSTESNPFNSLELIAGKLKAYSDHQVYTINLENLVDIQVDSY